LETDTIEETLEEVYLKAATVKKLTLKELQQQIATNWKQVFTI